VIDPHAHTGKLDPVLNRIWFLLFLWAAVLPLRAQDEPVHMTPEFPLIFPLVQNGTDVSVKYPVMVSPSTILKPGMVLRTIYILNYNPEGSTDLGLMHKGDIDRAYARDGGGTGPHVPAELAHEIEGYRRTVWQVSNNFVLAMAQYPTDSMHLIYSTTGKNTDLADTRFNFFDGLFVGLPNGRVTVIAVEKQSKADAAGIKAGDEIVSVGGVPTQDNLSAFANAYARAKDIAKENEVSSYPMTIRPGGHADTVQVNISLPPKIGGGLMDGFKP
jgi:hypothetical protein